MGMKLPPSLVQEILARPDTTVSRCGAVVDGKGEEPKRSKYGAVKTEVDGMTFASKKEARRYLELKALQEAGKIKGLELQPEYSLNAEGGIKVGRYRADFRYVEDGRVVVEDAKGYKTRDYAMRKRHMLAQYGIKIRET